MSAGRLLQRAHTNYDAILAKVLRRVTDTPFAS
jgi:hypothetical protein